MGGSGETLAGPPAGSGGSDGRSSPGLAACSGSSRPDHGPAQQLVLCLCFLARHPFATDYFNCGQFQKPPEGEAKVDEGEREAVAWECSFRSHTPRAGPEVAGGCKAGGQA